MTSIVAGLAMTFLVSITGTGRAQDVKIPDQINKLSAIAKTDPCSSWPGSS